MTASYIELTLILLLAVSILYKPVQNIIHPAKTVDKQISLVIYSNNNYTSPAYDEALAKVHVTVTKVKGTGKTIVWEKTFDAMPLKKYPTINNAFTQQVSIPKVLDGKEQLIISYTVTYNSKGSIIEFVNGEVVSKDVKKGKLNISI